MAIDGGGVSGGLTVTMAIEHLRETIFDHIQLGKMTYIPFLMPLISPAKWNRRWTGVEGSEPFGKLLPRLEAIAKVAPNARVTIPADTNGPDTAKILRRQIGELEKRYKVKKAEEGGRRGGESWDKWAARWLEEYEALRAAREAAESDDGPVAEQREATPDDLTRSGLRRER